MIAKVSIDRRASSINDYYDYLVPANLVDSISVGCACIVPFGFDQVNGFVIELSNDAPNANLKEIIEITNPASDFGLIGFSLAKELSSSLNCSFGNVYSFILPSFLKGKKELYLHVESFENLDPRISLLLNGKEKISYDKLPPDLVKLAEKEVLNGNLTKGYEFLYYKKKNKVLEYNLLDFSLTKSAIRKKVINYLQSNGPSIFSDIQAATSVSKATINAMVNAKILGVKEKEVTRVTEEKKLNKDIRFSFAQEEAYSYFYSTNASVPLLLNSNNDEFRLNFYLKLVSDYSAKGEKTVFIASSILKAEELALKLNRYLKGYKVLVYHSLQSKSENYDVYYDIKNGDYDCLIVVLANAFLPFDDAKLIILDDEEDTNYISESYPYFNVIEVTKIKARLQNARLIISSSNPSVSSMYLAQSGQYAYIEERNSEIGNVKVIDMNQELLEENNVIISSTLKTMIDDCLQRGKIILLVSNNLAYSNELRCRKCGKVVKCPKCKVPLTYSKKKDEVRCVYCGYKLENYNICNCGSHNFISFGFGIEQVREKIGELYPNARIIELSSTSLSSTNKIEEIMSAIEDGQVDFIIGTNASLNLSSYANIDLVGMLYVDSYMNASNYLASEETFVLLSKANKFKNCVIQTYNTNNYVLNYALTGNYKKFYNEEISSREMLNYPPFKNFSKVLIKGDYNEMFHFAFYVKKALSNSSDIELLGPVYDYAGKGVKLMAKYLDFDKLKKVLEDAKKRFNSSKLTYTIMRYTRGG